MDFSLAIAFVGGIFGGTFFRLASEYFERKISETESKSEDISQMKNKVYYLNIGSNSKSIRE